MKQRYSWMIAMFSMVGLISCAPQASDVTLKEGRELEKQGEYLEAQTHYQKMPDPTARADFQHNLHSLYGDIITALQAQQENPESAEPYYALGRAYYNKANSLEGENPVVNVGFDLNGYLAEQRTQYQENALSALDNAIEFSRSYAALPSGQMQIQTVSTPETSKEYQNGLFLQARLYEDRGEPHKAIEVYQQLANVPSVSAEPLYRLGLLLSGQGDTAQGLSYAERAVSQSPNDANAHFAKGLLLARETQFDQATLEFQQTICLNPTHAEAYYRIAQISFESGDFTEGVIDGERVLYLGLLNNPGNTRLYTLYDTLKSTLDSKEKEVASQLMLNISIDDDFVASPVFNLQYLQLLQQTIQRRRPYILPCDEMKASLQDRQFEHVLQEIQNALDAPADLNLQMRAMLSYRSLSPELRASLFSSGALKQLQTVVYSSEAYDSSLSTTSGSASASSSSGGENQTATGGGRWFLTDHGTRINLNLP